MRLAMFSCIRPSIAMTKQSFLRLTRVGSLLSALALSSTAWIHAQQPVPEGSASSSSSSAPKPEEQGDSSSATIPNGPPRQAKPPALIDPAGPAVSLETSEALFEIAAALNACGYDQGLDRSDPIRQHIRSQVTEAIAATEAAKDARDKVCQYIAQHTLSSNRLDLAQYVSLALYTTPPPALEASVELTDMPPDATQVAGILPLVRDFAQATQLRGIWLTNKHSYDEMAQALHDPLTKMIVATNAYLKMPASTYDNRRFLVVLEPMLAPGDINARIYANDYVVVASPTHNEIRMDDVRHTYLHYVVEPLLYSRPTSMDRMLPILREVREAPLDFSFRSDIVALTVECLIKAIEDRISDTGVPVYKAPAQISRNDFDRVDKERHEYEAKVAAVREQWVERDMQQGFGLTRYFFDQLKMFEKEPVSLSESMGEMVYGMDVEREVHHIRQTVFSSQGAAEVVGRAPRKLRGLDLAELDLIKGDTATAATLAQKELDSHTSDPGRAHFILARVAISKGDPESAIQGFQQTLKETKDSRLVAWSHIYQGRLLDMESTQARKNDDESTADDLRKQAVSEYKAALDTRDGQPDTRAAAEHGVKEPYAAPHHETHAEESSQSAKHP